MAGKQSNRILSHQLIGDHYIPAAKLKVNWVASYADIKRDVPALRRMVFDSSAGAPSYSAKLFDINPVDNDNTAGLTFYSTNKEKVNHFKIDFSRTFKHSKNLQSIFKIGGYYQKRDRVFTPRLLALSNFNASRFDFNLLALDPAVIFNQSSMGYLSNGKTGFALKDITEIRDQYSAGTELFSYYAMSDQRIGKILRLIYGVRVEDFHQTLNADYNQFTPIRVNTRKNDVLPSINTVVSLNSKMNLRLGYSKTLNRPEFRELAPFLFRDYTIKYSVFGDTALRRASIENYDLRYEFYPGKAQLISASAFYKKFTDPIELISVSNQDKTLSYQNTPSSEILGAELEFRTLLGNLLNLPSQSIWSKLSVFGNITLIKSKVNLKVTDTTNYYYKQGRVMQGQSPYVVNAGITYQNDEKNITSTISLNRYGQRIFLASNGDALQNGELIEPNLWENGRTQLDFQITKGLVNKNMELKLNVKDILAQKLIFFEDTNNNKKYDKSADALRSSLNYGRVISFSFTYKF
jgi:outer membrane receptor protein involved in Fe transport